MGSAYYDDEDKQALSDTYLTGTESAATPITGPPNTIAAQKDAVHTRRR